MPKQIATAEEFDAEIKSGKVLVDLFATWCGPCKMLSPIVDAVAEESDGSYKVGKVNVDEEGELAMQFGIASIPTLLVFKGGELVNKSVGLIQKDQVLALLK